MISSLPLFKHAYLSCFQSEAPEELNLEALVNEIREISRKIETEKLDENTSKLLRNTINDKFHIIYNISSLLKSFLIFSESSTKDVDSLFSEGLMIMKSIGEQSEETELAEIDVSSKISQWTEELRGELSKELEDVNEDIDKEKIYAHMCVQCKKRPSVVYSLPCGHTGYCAKCLKESQDAGSEYTMCLRCHKTVEESKPLILNK